MSHDIHDAMFKATFSEPEHAAGELRHLLPAKVSARIDFPSLALIPGTFVGESLARQHSDLLFSVRLSGRQAFIYWCLRHARSPEQIVLGIGRWLDLLREVRRAPNGMAALATLWRYIFLIGDKFGPEDLVDRLIAAVGEDSKEEIVTAGEQLIERGRKEGRRDGLQEGLQEGQRRLLKQQLQHRFGPLPEAALTRVSTADAEALDLWAERILTAPTLADVLGP